jgi:hypothetical protein
MPIKSAALMMPNESDLSVVQICHHCRNRRHLCLSSGAQADSAGLNEKSSWLLGNFTQNAPCKGELKVRIAADQIESKSGVCDFLAVTQEGNRLKANMAAAAKLTRQATR